jgi:phosphatidylglycerophosphate synthase
MPTVRFGAVTGLLAQAAVLGALALSVGLTPGGWLVGLACGWTVNATLARGLAAAGGLRLGPGPAASGGLRLGPANRITLTRATLVGGVAALVFDGFFHRVSSRRLDALVVLASVALVLDAVDGFVARRTNSVTALGARFDMEIDAFLIFVLSCHVAQALGAWVLAIGLARYAFVVAGWLLPWLRQPAPPRHWCKTVAAIQGIVLTVAAARVLPHQWLVGFVVVALALLAESFGHDIGWLWIHRPKAERDRVGGVLGVTE